MEALFKIIPAAIGIYLFFRIWGRARAAKIQQPAALVESAEAAVGTAPVEATGSSLAEKLRDLSGRIEPFAQDAAHPGEVAGHKDFKIARDVFASPDTPLDIVLNYAPGASFSSVAGRHTPPLTSAA